MTSKTKAPTKSIKSKSPRASIPKATASTFAERLVTWQGGEVGFYNWLSDIQPKILVRTGKYEIFEPTRKQREFIHEVLKIDPDTGRFKHTMNLNVEPRRHGKSTVFCLLVLWFFTSRRNFTVQLLGSSEDHCKRVQYNALKRVIDHTPKLARLIPERNHQAYHIQFLEMGNRIQFAASNLSTAFGDRINLLWVSDLHSFVDIGPYNALQAALLDSEDSLQFIDSNVDTTDGTVHQLQREAETDLSIYCRYTSYADLDTYLKEAPEWIDRAQAARLAKTSLPADFRRDILGLRSDAKNALFSQELIDQAKSKYRIPVVDLLALTQGRAYKIGAGLDRAKNLLAGPRGDHTVLSVVAKVARLDGEPEYFLLSQTKFLVNTSKNIKAQILEEHRRYKLDNLVLENFETADIYSWCIEQGIPCELISPHDTLQAASFPEMFRTFNESRFHYPESCTDFTAELGTFSYERRKNGTYSFGHSNQKFKDDTVYSTNWAIFALRMEVLTQYEINLVQCLNRSSRRSFCFLMGGNLDFKDGCGRSCTAYSEASGMFKQFLEFQMESELTLPGFFHAYVKLSGPRISQAV